MWLIHVGTVSYQLLLPIRGVQHSFNDFLLMTLVQVKAARGIPDRQAVGDPGF